MENKTKDRIFLLLIFIVILSIIFLVIYLKSESYQCIENPLVYGVKRYNGLSCSCSFENGKGFIVTNERIINYLLDNKIDRFK